LDGLCLETGNVSCFVKQEFNFLLALASSIILTFATVNLSLGFTYIYKIDIQLLPLSLSPLAHSIFFLSNMLVKKEQ